MAKNILITGGAGFIGSNFAEHVGVKYNLYAFDNLHPQVHLKSGRPEILPKNVELLTGDVTSAGDWDTVLKLVKPDIIVHLAAETGTGQSLTESSRHGSVNVVGTTNMIDALTRAKIVPEHIVLSSSRAIYGEGAWKYDKDKVFYPDTRPHAMLEAGQWDFTGSNGEKAEPIASRADLTKPNPSNIYAATKLAQENILSAWSAAMGNNLSILRFQNVYGPGQTLENSYTGVIAFFSRLAASGGTIDVYEDGEILRDFVYVKDVVSAMALCLEKPSQYKRTLDVGYGKKTTINDIAKIVAKMYGAPEPIISGKYRDGDVRAASCDTTKIEEELGYRPEWPPEKGLAELKNWVESLN